MSLEKSTALDVRDMTDDALITEYTVSHSDAHFAEVVRRHHDKIRNFLRYRFDCVEEDVDDILQEFWLKVSRKAHLYEGQSKLTTWLISAAMNTATSFRRKRKNRRLDDFNILSLDDHVSMDSFLVDKRCISPVDHASLAENQAIVRRVLTEIHSRGISLIKRYYEENSTYEALAKEEGIPVGTVRSRMNRSKEEIRTSLARFFPDHL